MVHFKIYSLLYIFIIFFKTSRLSRWNLRKLQIPWARAPVVAQFSLFRARTRQLFTGAPPAAPDGRGRGLSPLIKINCPASVQFTSITMIFPFLNLVNFTRVPSLLYSRLRADWSSGLRSRQNQRSRIYILVVSRGFCDEQWYYSHKSWQFLCINYYQYLYMYDLCMFIRYLVSIIQVLKDT
jgi:hypothetical protein